MSRWGLKNQKRLSKGANLATTPRVHLGWREPSQSLVRIFSDDKLLQLGFIDDMSLVATIMFIDKGIWYSYIAYDHLRSLVTVVCFARKWPSEDSRSVITELSSLLLFSWALELKISFFLVCPKNPLAANWKLIEISVVSFLWYTIFVDGYLWGLGGWSLCAFRFRRDGRWIWEKFWLAGKEILGWMLNQPLKPLKTRE